MKIFLTGKNGQVGFELQKKLNSKSNTCTNTNDNDVINNSTPWVEKYRPKTLNDITAQTDVIKSLKKVLETKNLPHLLFFGPSGCGKTSTIIALAKELFGDMYNDRIIELNASDENGINIVREKLHKIYLILVLYQPKN